MRTFQYLMPLLGLFVICGCPASTQSTKTEPKDDAIEKLIFLGGRDQLNGYWDNNRFGGEFRHLKFVRQTGQQNDQIVCEITGKGALWSPQGSITYSISGTSGGRKIAGRLVLDQPEAKQVDVSGEIGEDTQGHPTCTITFSYNGQSYTAPLLLSTERDIPEHQGRFLAKLAENGQ